MSFFVGGLQTKFNETPWIIKLKTKKDAPGPYLFLGTFRKI